MNLLVKKLLLLLSVLLLIYIMFFSNNISLSPYPCDFIYESPILCLDEGPEEDWFGSGRHSPKSSPTDGICGEYGYFSSKSGHEPTIVTTPNLEESGCYWTRVWYRVGLRGQPQDEENFKLICNNKEYEFPDYKLDNSGVFTPIPSVLCEFAKGTSTFILEGTGSDSVHFEQFQLSACIKDGQAICGSPLPNTQLPFFTFANALASILMVIIIYLLYSIIKKPKAKTSKRKLKTKAYTKTNFKFKIWQI
jgi:hypothetical protein